MNRCSNCSLIITEHNEAFETGKGLTHDECPIQDERTREAVKTLIESDTLDHQKLLAKIFTKLFQTRAVANKRSVQCKKCKLQFLTAVRGNSAKCSFCGASNWVPTNVDELLEEGREQ